MQHHHHRSVGRLIFIMLSLFVFSNFTFATDDDKNDGGNVINNNNDNTNNNNNNSSNDSSSNSTIKDAETTIKISMPNGTRLLNASSNIQHPKGKALEKKPEATLNAQEETDSNKMLATKKMLATTNASKPATSSEPTTTTPLLVVTTTEKTSTKPKPIDKPSDVKHKKVVKNKEENVEMNKLIGEQQNFAGKFTDEDFAKAEDSHFIYFIVGFGILLALIYMCAHNKKKLLGLLIEGKRPTGSRRLSSSIRYRRLSQREDAPDTTGSSYHGTDSNIIY